MVIKKDKGREPFDREKLMHGIVKACEKPSSFKYLYPDEMSIKEKIETVAREIYGADSVKFDDKALKNIDSIMKVNPEFGKFPICVAKTQYSLSDNPKLLGRPTGFDLTVREVKVSAGAGFIVVLTGEIMTMPGLPKEPAALKIDVDENGNITGLF